MFICFGTVGWDCTGLWLAGVAVFFIAAILRKQLVEMIGMDFSMWGGLIVGEIGLILSVVIMGNLKWAVLIALIGTLAGGFLLAPFFGDTSESDGGGGGLYG